MRDRPANANKNLLRVVRHGRYFLVGVHGVAADTPAPRLRALHDLVDEGAATSIDSPRWRQRE